MIQKNFNVKSKKIERNLFLVILELYADEKFIESVSRFPGQSMKDEVVS